MRRYSGYFVDPEVLVVEGETAIGAERFMQIVEEQKVYAVTDDSVYNSRSLRSFLERAGVPVDGALTGVEIAEKSSIGNSFYILGEGDLMSSTKLKNDASSNLVLVGLDTNFSYEKIRKVRDKLEADGGKMFFCSNRELSSLNAVRPHQRPINQALKDFGSSELLGFPSQNSLDIFNRAFSYLPDKSLMVSDRFDMVEAGNKLGMDTALLLSKSDKKQIKQQPDIRLPDYGVSSLQSLSKNIQFSSS